MAQRTEKEETEFTIVPDSITPCINNCHVTGNPASSMCQKCFSTSLTTSSSSIASKSIIQLKSPRPSSPRSSPKVKFPDLEVKEIVQMKMAVNRCSGCRRKVGLTGFRCRCGHLFCSQHRYTDRHDCSFDYKSAGREVIARENPVVKAAKIVRI